MPIALRTEKLNLSYLMYVFRSWWLIRLPGTLYAISIGKNLGPAPDLQSELSLLGFDSFTSGISKMMEKELQKFSTLPSQSKSSPKTAFNQINALFDSAQGKFELGGSVSRVQRRRLKEILEESMPAELSRLADQQIIVRAFIDFVKYLLVEGGQRKYLLKFSTIRTYVSSLRLLVELFWDVDLYEADAETYHKVYESFFELNKNKVTRADGRVQLFHRFLRDTLDAPYCYLGKGDNKIPVGIRSIVITNDAFDQAWSMVDQIECESEDVKNAIRSYLSLGYAYGLRRKEAYGLEASRILVDKDSGIVVKQNKYRDLKSRSGKRLVPNIFLNKKLKKHLSTQISMLNLAAAGNECLFQDAEERQQLLSTNKIDNCVRSLLRINTKNLDVVPYSMRHTAATRFAHFSFKAPREIPFSKRVDLALGYDGQQTMFDSFSDGFKAWPFWMDRAAMFIGHGDVDTLLDNYWHTSSIRLAEYTWPETEVLDKLKDESIANLLGKSRSSVIAMRKRLGSKGEFSEPVKNERLIQHYIYLEGKKIYEKTAADKPAGNLEDELDDMYIDAKQPMQWIFLDRLFVWRLIEGAKLSDIKKKALSIGVQNGLIESFIEKYKSLVFDLGCDDFEPIGSELILKKKIHSDGVIRGKVERRTGLAKIQRLFKSSDEFSSLLKNFVKIWIERVNFKDPWFVARSESELRIILDVLFQIGVSETQLEFCCCHGFDRRYIINCLHGNFLQQVQYQDKRISRGDSNVVIPELGVRVMQLRGAEIGDGRDTHRLVMLVAVLVNI